MRHKFKILCATGLLIGSTFAGAQAQTVANQLAARAEAQPGAQVQTSTSEATAEIRKAEAWLENLKTARADFTQVANNGGTLEGVFTISRPGRLRFDYNALDDFIVADGAFIYFYDATAKQQTNAPIGATLADFMLRPDVSLGEKLLVTEINKNPEITQISIVQKDDPGAGTLILGFQNNPYQLKKWRVIDPQGNITEIELNNLKTGVDLDKSQFRYIDPEHGKGGFNS